MEEMIQQLHTALGRAGTKYVIIGGIAASILGKPRTTLDADVVAMIEPDNLNALLGNLKLHGFKISESSRERILQRLRRLLPVKIRYGKFFSIDIRVASYTIDREAIMRAVSVKLFGKLLPIATAEDLIVYKIARFEDIDKADIKAIINRAGKKIDIQYIKGAANKLAMETGKNTIKKNLREISGWLR